MIGFSGTYSATIDDKGRVVLPATFKKDMGELALEPLIIERNLFKGCLDIHPERFWQDRVMAFKKTLDPFDEQDDEFLQFFYQNFKKATMAPNGRINITPDYLEYGKLTKDVYLIGMGHYIRIWDVKEYNKTAMDNPTFLQRYKERRKNKSEE